LAGESAAKETLLNILTKISVVVLALLILVACVVFVTQATVVPNYKSMLMDSQDRLKAAGVEIQQKEIAVQKAAQDAAASAARADAAERKAASESNTVWQLLSDERAKGALAQASLDRMGMTLGQLAATEQAQGQWVQGLFKGLDAERAKAATAAEKQRLLNDQINELSLRGETLAGDVRRWRDQYYQSDERVKQLEDALSKAGKSASVAGAATGGEPLPSGPAITGTVDAVNAEKGIASLNIGSAQGMRRGMIASVSRGAEFVCEVQIEVVNTQDSAGVVVNNRKRMNPEKGDKFEIIR
jgi:hypothetical protein